MMGLVRRCVLRPVLLLALAGVVLADPAATLAQQAREPAAMAATRTGADLATRVWDAALAGDSSALKARLDEVGASDPDLAASIAALRANLQAREARRAEQIAKITEEMDRMLAADRGDLGLSAALRSATALRMISPDKEGFVRQPKIADLIERSHAAAKAAENRGDWLTAQELFVRLSLLTEEEGTFKDDVRREQRRLAMIRLYAPERFWELRNARRNAEIEFNRVHRKTDETGRAEGAQADDNRPLPPYNPIGDDFRQKLRGVDRDLVRKALAQGFLRHVERTPMEKMLREVIGSVRTLATTEDLKGVFPALGDASRRSAMLAALDELEARLREMAEPASIGDLDRVMDRLVEANARTLQLPEFVLMHEIGNGGMDALDEFSGVIWPDEMRRFQRTTQGRFFGVGVQIEQDPLQNIRVVTPIEGTPAQRAGIQRDDIIKKVNGNSTVGFTLDQAVDNITGPRGTPVSITVEREVMGEDGQSTRKEIEFRLIRDEVPIWSVRGWERTGDREDDWNWFIDPQRKIGYLRLSQFAERTSRDLDNAIEAMRRAGLQAIILDMRFNPGGLLDQAVEVSSRFIDAARVGAFDGVVVSTHRADNVVVARERAARGKASLAGLPVAVLVNEGSASASEIVAGAIQDYARAGRLRAVVIGQRTFGKGSVQNVWPIPTPQVQAAVKVTTNYYHLPGGRMIHRRPSATSWGVSPDVAVEMLPEQVADALRQRSNADVRRGRTPTESENVPRERLALNTANPMATPDLQLQYALVLLQSQVRPVAGVLTERPGAGVANP